MIRHCFQQVLQEFPGRLPIGLIDELRNSEFAGSVNGNKEIELAFLCSDLGNIDVEIANRVSLELLPFWLVTVHFRQPGNAVALKTAMQRRAR